MSAIVLRGDAAHLPLPDGSVDLICTSPPYWSLRSYADGGEHYAGQIGSEGTPAEYIAALLGCTREWARVLKPEGSLFVNLGDKYSGAAGPHTGKKPDALSSSRHGHSGGPKWTTTNRRSAAAGFRDKSLIGLLWRYALGCMDDLGLILRAEIVWQKPNGLPESVTDRVRRSHEQVFHFTRQPRYYAAVDEIREPHESPVTPGRRHNGAAFAAVGKIGSADGTRHTDGHPLGKLPGSVWEIPSQPLTVPARLGVDHFAAFPMELPRRIILGWSPPGICTACGEGRRPVADVEQRADVAPAGPKHMIRYSAKTGLGKGYLHTITGYACACPQPDAPTRPAVVVDPFGGTGTTALVADMLGRTGYSFDRSADYCRLARWRTTDPGERARAIQVPKPPAVPENQGSLFDDLDAAGGAA